MKRNFRVIRNEKEIPCKPGQFNDCWDIINEENDGYGNFIETGFSLSNDVYLLLRKNFNRQLQQQLTEVNELLSDALEYFPENSNFGIGDKIREYQSKYKSN